MTETLVLGAIFLAVLVFAFTGLTMFQRQRDLQRTLSTTKQKADREKIVLDSLPQQEDGQLGYFIDVVKKAGPNSIQMRLVQAGYFSPRDVTVFNFVRLGIAVGFCLLGHVLLGILRPESSQFALMVAAVLVGGLGFVLCGIVLEQMGKRKQAEYRKIFPDMMDLLLVCVDAGLSLNASIDRVNREFLRTVPGFGIQLSILNLEIRAGRPIHEALNNLAMRIQVDEARMLAVLFRQSEELGSSVARTLRTFAKEMRQMRIIRAEEKANTLPLKMLFPMALCMFPVSLLIVLVPIVMTLLEFLDVMSPA
ncbi:Flp pilus assembly protein TadB [Tritonibacter multivorans]|uniref:Flp pilus assembly protein TadB n=1 Tax=Tritonibacter multivorans TaxID=928856 RepID=A0A0P1GGY2_9RHOB|nr:type II secretion system F family protein [Tritonibacter multivorans]MDA7422448.1 type II secretion system F family protein [Tritonibacter multivorans]CUH74924.1 Flp pilus assembly protein TadB [Tritonibacter multivorans]SFD43748.1 tight adherence protein C [Tritonibacter multivorans]